MKNSEKKNWVKPEIKILSINNDTTSGPGASNNENRIKYDRTAGLS